MDERKYTRNLRAILAIDIISISILNAYHSYRYDLGFHSMFIADYRFNDKDNKYRCLFSLRGTQIIVLYSYDELTLTLYAADWPKIILWDKMGVQL